jgi:hypothetical protein
MRYDCIMTSRFHHADNFFMRKIFTFITVIILLKSNAQENNIITVRDAFLNTVTDARTAGQADVSTATSSDSYSQFTNPSKYIFSETKAGIAFSHIFNNGDAINDYKQLNFIFYNNLDNRSAYAIGFRNYGYGLNSSNEFVTYRSTFEVAIDGSYALKLSDQLSMAVTGRFIALNGKASLVDRFTGQSNSNLYGVDVSGFYNGDEVAYKKFNGRWRVGVVLANLRGKGSTDDTDIEIYAPSLAKIGVGFDFIFNQNLQLGVTSEYRMLLQSYDENTAGERLNYGLEGAVAAIGFELVHRDKIRFRTGYSRGIERLTDTFFTLGAGFRGDYADIDLAYLMGLSEDENPVREKLRLSLSLNLAEVLSNVSKD